MTWIVGCNTIFGQGLIASDVRVTVNNSHHDILNKVYEVGRYLICGFSGSVFIGFEMITDLHRYLYLNDTDQADSFWDTQQAAIGWASHAKSLFDSAPISEQRHGCSLIIVGTQENSSGLNGYRSVTTTFRSPDFVPNINCSAPYFDSIGSGSDNHLAMDYLSNTVSNYDFMKIEVGYPGGFANHIAGSMSLDLHLHGSLASVSPFLNVSVVDHFQIFHRSVQVNDQPLPPLVNNYSDLCSTLGLNSSTCHDVLS